MYDDKPIIITKAQKAAPKKNFVSLDDKELRFVPREVSEMIKKGREKLMISQKELAMKIAKKPSVIAEWEKGTAQYEEKLAKKLEEALNVKFNVH